MSPAEAAATIREAMRHDHTLTTVINAQNLREGYNDIYEWCDDHPEMAIALAEQVADIAGQISEFDRRLNRGDLS